MTSASRLLEVWDLLRGDFRVKVKFTVNATSRFSTGVPELLRASGVVPLVPWQELRESHYDLAVSASENIDFSALASRTVVVPHGLGFNKYVPETGSRGTRLAGLPPAAALRTGRVAVVLSHPEQERQLLATSPEIAGHTVVTGDPTFDRLLASAPLRHHYRRRLGSADRRLILLSSTWRPESQLGRWRTLPQELLAELPADGYQVAAVLHPNIWTWYGEAQIRIWFADALDAGLLLIPPHRGWQAALVAADQVIGDHGSMSLHAAALGKPLLLAAFGSKEVVPGTPIDELGRVAPHLDPHHSLREQLDKAAATHDPRRLDPITARVFAHVGSSIRRLRDLLYHELELSPPPAVPPLIRVPDPLVERQRVTAFEVDSAFTDASTITVIRYPKAVRVTDEMASCAAPEIDNMITHLAVDEEERNLRLTQKASVLTRHLPTGAHDAATWSSAALRNFPATVVAAARTPNGCLALLRDGRQVDVRVDTVQREAMPDVMALASAVYTALMANRLTDREFTLRLGAREVAISLFVSSRKAQRA